METLVRARVITFLFATRMRDGASDIPGTEAREDK